MRPYISRVTSITQLVPGPYSMATIDLVCCDPFLRYGSPKCGVAAFDVVANCHTYFSKENQVLNYMYARIKFHTYSDIISE
jgi:hypothetical protein